MHRPPTVARRPFATWQERFGQYPPLKAQGALRVAFSTASSDQIEVYADMPCDLGGAANCMTSQLNGFALHVGAASSFLGYGQSFQPVWPAPFSSFSVLTRQNSTLCSSLRDDTRTGISHIPFWFTGYMSYSALPSNPLCIPDTQKTWLQPKPRFAFLGEASGVAFARYRPEPTSRSDDRAGASRPIAPVTAGRAAGRLRGTARRSQGPGPGCWHRPHGRPPRSR